MIEFYRLRAVMWLYKQAEPNNKMSYAIATTSAALNMAAWWLEDSE